MPSILVPELFDPNKLGLVRGFECGQESWSQHAALWIKTPPSEGRGALWSMQKRKTAVFLYFDPSDALVGFGSLGKTNWDWPAPGDPKRELSYIPQMAIQIQFRGMPKGPNETKYSRQIIRDLIARSYSHGTDMLGLHVDPQNTAAISLYRAHEFHEIPNRRDKHGNIFMVRLLQ
jgi:ribosomal protein S18 acetylase RimI-like enzyme